VIELAGVSKRFGDRIALRELTLSVESGEVLALLGANGAGKTTLLRICAGMLAPDSGEVHIGGNARVGAVLAPQTTWYPRLSGRRNLEFFGVAAGLTRSAARAAAERGLALAGLDADADAPVAAYSTGMRARLALARAQTTDPAALLLDEPSAGLDEQGVARFKDQLLNRPGKVATIMSTHDLALAETLADRVLVLEAGRLAEPA
jgi:ABC-type multidrug transport system ATPase subunit